MQQEIELNYYHFQPNIDKLIDWHTKNPGNRNEATTRLHLINELIFQCLGWNKENVTAEDSEDGVYTDYTFTIGKRLLILEAKREGDTFTIPAGTTRQTEHKLSTLMRDNPNLNAAIVQVAGYAHTRGVSLAAVSNGTQLVAFIASRDDGKNVFEGRCLVFDSLQRMKDNFRLLWDFLSPPALIERRLFRKLMGDTLPQLPPRLAERIANYPGIKRRNTVQVELQLLSAQVLEDIPKDPALESQFLDECYCQSGALPQHSQLNRFFLESRYSMLFEKAGKPDIHQPAVTKRGIDPDIMPRSLSRRPILLLGDVGVGKTSFIKYLRKDAAEILKNAFEFYIDLGTTGALASSIKTFILSEIERQMRSVHNININEDGFLRSTFKEQIKDFAAGVNRKLKDNNPAEYQTREIARLQQLIDDRPEFIKLSVSNAARIQNKQVVFFLDNSDQRNEIDQQEAFLVAQEIAEGWNSVVYISLRPETYELSQRTGTLSGYHPRTFTIAPPRVSEVIAKRIEFAIKILNGDIRSVEFNRNDPNVALMGKVLLLFSSSLMRNKSLQECLENITGGNVRTALDYVKAFFGSGHIDTEKMVSFYDESGYIVPVHEFLRAIIFGDYEYYSPSKSRVANLFSIQSLDGIEHFLLPLLINVLNVDGIGDSNSGGFVPTTKVYEQLQSLGFGVDQIDFALERSLSAKLVETATRRIPQHGDAMPDALRVTSIGLYTANVLSGSFTYVDAMIVDTPILDNQYFNAITADNRIKARLSRAKIFRSYLDSKWIPLKGVKLPFNWAHQSKLLGEDIDRVLTAVQRKEEIELRVISTDNIPEDASS